MKKVKFSDISELTGVSETTISRYFNKPEKLSSKTKTKISNAIQELQYTRDNFAKILSTGESNLIGVILPNLHLSFYNEFLSQIIDYCKNKDYDILIYTSNKSIDEEKHMISSLMSYRIKGLVLLSHMLSAKDIEELNVPVVTVERVGGNFKQINSDNFSGGKMAGELLIQNDCDVFLHINNGYFEEWPSFKRILGFEFATKNREYQLFVHEELTDTFSRQARDKMKSIVSQILLNYQNKKIGIFCSNDNIANLLQIECLKNNIKIPEEIEIIGYDNAPISDSSIYPITSIEQNIELMAKLAIDSIDDYSSFESLVPARLIKKSTTT